MKFIRNIFLVNFLFVLNSPVTKSANQNENFTERIDNFIRNKIKQIQLPGFIFGILKNNQIFHAASFGFSNVELSAPVTFETVFQSGSVGKQFTAAAIMILVERDQIQLDQSIRFYFPDAPTTWNKITVRHLLTHTSGLPGYPEPFPFRHDFTEQEIYDYIKTVPLLFNPGENWFYSNLGYVILGVIIRRVTGQFYGDFLDENIFKPFHMNTARVISESDIIRNRASGYILVNNTLKNQFWVSPSLNTLADGALYLTFNDMVQWDRAFYQRQLFKLEQTYQTIWSPVTLQNGTTFPYGFGWQLAETKLGQKVVQHRGSWQGFQALFGRIFDVNITYIFFANLNHPSVYRTFYEILEIYDPMLVPETV